MAMKPSSKRKCDGIDKVCVRRVFDFLEANSSWNQEFQDFEFRRSLSHCVSAVDPGRARLEELLRSTANTQSQPRMGLLGEFWRTIHKLEDKEMTSMAAFTASLEAKAKSSNLGVGSWERLFLALGTYGGWGPKTSALFVKNVIRIHQGSSELHFWNDASLHSRASMGGDRVYLPVDSVITAVFSALGMKSPDFDLVNEFLHEEYDAAAMTTWDDLWFWGFFTQVVEKAPKLPGVKQATHRKMQWNTDKFWCQAAAPKEREEELKIVAQQFNSLFEGLPGI